MSKTFALGVSMIYFGAFIRQRCYTALGKLFTYEMSIRSDHYLVTTGPYAFVRHPGYTGVLLTVTGVAVWHTCPGSWTRECGVMSTNIGRVAATVYLILVSLITSGLLLRMSKEDEALKRNFQKDWEKWSEEVPYRLIPGLF
ncbi:hypothetical protein BDQ12DRAFT_672666 [Crucibulum laeve]|uniref:Protein-S-isoprenylcysteine O-methyltransferase n=1 Tax=Crucibulum laeve TaxID=68775 RepID=A0A5C3MSE3_9AGAR|nr:hypothetical protein BDQ12DRAFT_672666 [Crucibulum laeve]